MKKINKILIKIMIIKHKKLLLYYYYYYIKIIIK